MGDPSRPGRGEARELVESISEELGFLPDKLWASFTAEAREGVKKAFQKKDNMIFASVSTLANNLYESSARFVFELLQNADDNCFKKAKDKNEDPYVSFQMYHDRIVVDCNEDGFTHDNLKAISAVGKSSKASSSGYIGEKGIGFKSVFMVAWKVTIQSGDFSFYFKHRRHETGLGMIRPRWVEPEESLPLNMTRMTLLLHEGDPEEVQLQRSIIRKQLSDLKESLLLFTQNLKEIRVTFYDDQDQVERTSSFSTLSLGGNRRSLIRCINDHGEETKTSQIYHLTTREVNNLEKSENRTYSAEEERTKAYAKSKIVLGFPLTENSVPIEAYQSIYAFLPVKKSSFNFLIQGDFVTSANRQNIVTSSRRNAGLLEAIADTLVQAVLEFCEHPALRYTWMRFLPRPFGFRDEFWAQLFESIKMKLQSVPVLEASEQPSHLQLISSLRRYSDNFLDQEGDLMFDDSRCVSQKYAKSDLDRLTVYGLCHFTPDEMLDMVGKELGKGGDSRLLSDETCDEWHERCAVLLQSIINRPASRSLHRLQSMPILPLKDGKYAAPNAGAVYFPRCSTTSVKIPDNLDLAVLSPSQNYGPSRTELFVKLGVSFATVQTVRDSILEKHKKAGKFPITSWVDQLYYLYLTHHLVQSPRKDDRLKVVDHERFLRSPHSVDVFYPEEEEFGAYSVLSGEDAASENINLRFLLSDYLSRGSSKPGGATKSWREWLCSYVGIRQYVKLATQAPAKEDLSKELYFVSKHRPDKLVGFLRYNWQEGGKEISAFSGLASKLQDLEVPCERGPMKFKHTFLPLSDLRELCSRYLRHGEDFPFLKLNEAVQRGSYLQSWAFLVDILRVGVDPSTVFYLHILDSISSGGGGTVEDPCRVLNVYEALYGLYAQELDKEDFQKQMRDDFCKKRILVSRSDGTSAVWVSSSECIWDAPAIFHTKYQLKWKLADLLDMEEEDIEDSDIGRFFRKVIQIPLLTWKDILEELRHVSRRGIQLHIDTIRDLYHRLDGARVSLSNHEKDELRSIFETEPLIFNHDDERGWFKVSQCLWYSETNFEGRTILSENYDDLELFFVNFLHVETLTAQILFNALLNQSCSSSAPDDLRRVKSHLKALNNFIPDIGDYPDIDASEFVKRSACIFPIRRPDHSVIELVSHATNFVIADRVHLGNFFSGKVKVLDFDLNEARELAPLFGWLGIESRYMSRSVREITAIDETDARPVLPSQNQVQLKAKALCRIAYHFRSPRLDRMSLTDLLNVLQSSLIYETDGISSMLQLPQDGKPIEHELERSDLHIGGSVSTLKIFVPRTRKRRDFCYASKLPSGLFNWLMADPITNIVNEADMEKGRRIVSEILRSRRSLIPEILDSEGIVSAGIEMGNEDDESDDDESQVSETLIPSVEGSSTLATDDAFTTHDNGNDGMSHGLSFRPSEASPSIERRIVSATATYSSNGGFGRTFSSVDNDTDTIVYRRLLEKVVGAARRAVIPPRTTGPLDDMTSLNAALNVEAESSYYHMGQAVRFGSKSQLERDKMVGAAGELYMFELLKSLSPSLPMFNVSNWQSTIRDLVRVHPDYSQISRWPGQWETADLVYDDVSGGFTKVLIECGYLDSSWEGCTPNYLLEVKTTTGQCETPFFMSQTQYERLSSHRNSRQTVYIVCRVFNLNSSRIGLRLYVDPAEMQATGELVFTAGGWSIVPGHRRN